MSANADASLPICKVSKTDGYIYSAKICAVYILKLDQAGTKPPAQRLSLEPRIEAA